MLTIGSTGFPAAVTSPSRAPAVCHKPSTIAAAINMRFMPVSFEDIGRSPPASGSPDPTPPRTEIDFNEFYGDDGYHATVHLWAAAKQQPGETVTKHIMASGFKHKIGRDVFKDLKAQGGGTVRGFHTYGGEITPQWTIMYFDRKELGRFPTMEESKTPLYLLLTVVVTKQGEANGTFPMDMIVKNVSAYTPRTPYPEK